MTRRRLNLIPIVLCILLQGVSAADVAAEKISYAFDALYRGVFSAVASYAAIPRLSLPGVSIEEQSSDQLSYSLSFNRSDISEYRQVFSPSSSTWYGRLMQRAGNTLSPLSRVAVALLDSAQYRKGEVILDGVIITDISSSGSVIRSYLELMLGRDWSSVEFSVKVSVVVSGSGTGIPLAFEGELVGKGSSDGKSITLTTAHMECNGTEIVIMPMIFRAVEKENNSEDSGADQKVS